jgi:Magnesium transporter NIPA
MLHQKQIYHVDMVSLEPHLCPNSYVHKFPGFLVYCCIIIIVVLILIFRVAPRYGQKQMLVYISICSLMGSLTVYLIFFVSIKVNIVQLTKISN